MKAKDVAYRPGDRVLIVDKWDPFTCENSMGFMDKYLGTVMTIDHTVGHSVYKMKEDNGTWLWNKFCIKGYYNDIDSCEVLNMLD